MSVFKIDNIPVSLTLNIGDTDNICNNLSPYFYRAVMMPQCLSVCPSVTFRSLGAVITLDGILRKYFQYNTIVMRL